ncbi:MAG TPA: sigma-70 family RNA polymerase sigma factor [Thermoanaerobaculia bacterium]|nr:sigma-70 family RNA polymerase sigma factor [Thermoanaerobaculia bacterium]
MSVPPVELTQTRTAQEIEDVYRLHFNLLKYLACQKFKITENDAENVIHEVFVAYLSAAGQVRDVRSWLVGAMCNASRNYWRSHGRLEGLPADMGKRGDPASAGLADAVATKVTVRETLSRLHQKCQDTLRLRYMEGCSAIEVATQLETTSRYAEKLIAKCLKRAHEIYVRLTSGKVTP